MSYKNDHELVIANKFSSASSLARGLEPQADLYGNWQVCSALHHFHPFSGAIQ